MQFPAGAQIFICMVAVDFRKSFDGLCECARSVMGKSIQGECVFVFFNRNRNRIKMVWLDHTGSVLLYKRLHRGRFDVPLENDLRILHREISQDELLTVWSGKLKVKTKKEKVRSAHKYLQS